MKKLKFPNINELNLDQFKKMSQTRMKSVKGGYTSHTVTLPGGIDDNDDGIRND